MNVAFYERIWMWAATAIIAIFLGAIFVTAAAQAVEPPSHIETVDPTTILSHPEFGKPAITTRPDGSVVVPVVAGMNLNQQSSGPQWVTHQRLMDSLSPIVDCGVHYVDVWCQITSARPRRVHAIGTRLTGDLRPGMDLVATDTLPEHPVLGTLGPEPLSPEFDAAALARAVRGRKTPLKVALLDQRVVAGLGNIYAAEALHVARLSPQRAASTIATRSGGPRDPAVRLAAAIKQVLTEAIARQASPSYRDDRFRVYDREAERCRRARCGGTIRRRTQAGRSTFFCPVCQR